MARIAFGSCFACDFFVTCLIGHSRDSLFVSVIAVY
jgi:hypothetical protein